MVYTIKFAQHVIKRKPELILDQPSHAMPCLPISQSDGHYAIRSHAAMPLCRYSLISCSKLLWASLLQQLSINIWTVRHFHSIALSRRLYRPS